MPAMIIHSGLKRMIMWWEITYIIEEETTPKFLFEICLRKFLFSILPILISPIVAVSNFISFGQVHPLSSETSAKALLKMHTRMFCTAGMADDGWWRRRLFDIGRSFVFSLPFCCHQTFAYSWTSLNGTFILYAHSWKFSRRRRQSDSSCKYMKRRYKFSRLSQLPLSGDSQPMQYTHSSYIQTTARLLIYCLLMNGFDEGRQRAKVHKFPVKMSLDFLMSKFGFLPPTQ